MSKFFRVEPFLGELCTQGKQTVFMKCVSLSNKRWIIKKVYPYILNTDQGWPGNTGGGNSQWYLPVITVLGNTPNFGKVRNTGKYEIL